MAYTYTNGDGVTVLDPATPNGAAEPVSNLDDAVKQIKAWIRDTTSNVGAAGMQTAITALQTGLAAGSVAGSSLFKANAAAQIDSVFAAPGTNTEALLFGSIEFNPDSVFATSIFTAPAAGYYEFTVKIHLEVTAGSPTGNSFLTNWVKNGTPLGNEAFGEDLSGSTYVGGTTAKIQLAAGDEITVQVAITITGGSGTWSISANNTTFSGMRIR